MKIKINSKSFPAEAGPTGCAANPMLIVPTLRVGMHPRTLRVHLRLKPIQLAARILGRTGFSREEAGVSAISLSA